jgi:hypothetical protein
MINLVRSTTKVVRYMAALVCLIVIYSLIRVGIPDRLSTQDASAAKALSEELEFLRLQVS